MSHSYRYHNLGTVTLTLTLVAELEAVPVASVAQVLVAVLVAGKQVVVAAAVLMHPSCAKTNLYYYSS